jgi:hypothetical protein
MASSTQHYFQTSGITMGWTELVVGALTGLFIYTGLIIRYSYDAKNRVSTMPLSGQHYFRISRIPTGWTEVSVVGGLKSLEPTRIHDDESPCLSLFQACNDSTQTGILKLENYLELLETTKSDTVQLELSVEGESVCIDIDDHFFDLTPLNTPGNEYTVE